MSGRLSARAIEALTGAGLGAAGAGTLGYLTHESDRPTEWLDEEGNFRSRALSKEERKSRSDKILKAALVGMGLGAAGSLGGGALRRYRLSSAEAEDVPNILKERLSGLKNVLAEFESEAKKARIPGTSEAAKRAKRVTKAKSAIAENEQKIRDLLSEAADARAGAAWGGLRLTGAGRTPVPHQDLTHRGRVEKYYRDLQEQVLGRDPAHPPMQSISDPEEYGQKFFRTLLKKQASAQALTEELRGIHHIEPLLAGRALARLAAEQAAL